MIDHDALKSDLSNLRRLLDSIDGALQGVMSDLDTARVQAQRITVVLPPPAPQEVEPPTEEVSTRFAPH